MLCMEACSFCKFDTYQGHAHKRPRIDPDAAGVSGEGDDPFWDRVGDFATNGNPWTLCLGDRKFVFVISKEKRRLIQILSSLKDDV